MNEADTCRTLVRPKLEASGWEAVGDHFFSEQTPFTDGRIIVPGGKPRRLKKKFSDFLLRYTRDITLAVVEAKSDRRTAGGGLQQAKEYAEILGLKFAYATNGVAILEYDYFTNWEREIDTFPAPAELWARYQQGQGHSEATSNALLVPYYLQPKKEPRYYQKIAFTRAVESILKGRKRNLLTMATGTGKTQMSFQICWKLWSAGWNAKGEPGRKPRILFLADRNVLVDDSMAKDFSPFGDARWKIQGEAVKSREMCFDLYQSLAADEKRPGLYKEYAPDFFDLIVIDECHRGSARDESNWREILDYFEPAFQLGMTAMPLREDNRDTYGYFGDALYTYSLKQGIEDGFLAPYRVHRMLTTFDAAGWRPDKGQVDKYKREILNDLLDKYAEHDVLQFTIPDALQVPPISERGKVVEIAGKVRWSGQADERSSETSIMLLRGIRGKAMKPVVFDDVTIQGLFGHEAAEDEDPERLRSYYFKSAVFERATANLPLRILVGHKGLGKSALFQVALHEDAINQIYAILLRPDDVHEVHTDSDILTAIRNWKEGLLRILLNKTIAGIGATPDVDPSWLSKRIPLIDKMISIAKPLMSKYVDTDLARKTIAESILNKRILRVYIDDLDRGWNASPKSIARLSSLLNACRDLVKEHPGLQFRISLRSDVYYLVRTSDESTDKIEGSVIWYSWTNHDILAMLIKRVQSFFGNEIAEDRLVRMDQFELATYLEGLLAPRFQGYAKWSNIPTHRMMMSLIRRRPRDLVKLCSLAAHSAFRRKSSLIETMDFSSIFEEYSQGRLQDTVNEYRSELASIETLLLSMRPSRQKTQTGRPFTFTTGDLLKKLRDIMSMQAEFRFYSGRKATEKELATFLYKINFLTGRKEDGDKIIRQYFEESRYLSSSFVDFGFNWEVHPAYRWALLPGEAKQVVSNLEETVDS